MIHYENDEMMQFIDADKKMAVILNTDAGCLLGKATKEKLQKIPPYLNGSMIFLPFPIKTGNIFFTLLAG
jgi:hypothetical protein